MRLDDITALQEENRRLRREVATLEVLAEARRQEAAALHQRLTSGAPLARPASGALGVILLAVAAAIGIAVSVGAHALQPRHHMPARPAPPLPFPALPAQLVDVGDHTPLFLPLAPTTNPANSAPAVLSIQGEPSLQTVLVDGQARGLSPLRLHVEPGPHSLEIRRPDGTLLHQTHVFARPGSLIEAHF